MVGRTQQGDGAIDVSGHSVNDKGKLVNNDIPEDERRSARLKKSKKTSKADKLRKLKDEDSPPSKRRRSSEEEDTSKKKKKKKKKIDSPPSDKALAKLNKRKSKFEKDLKDVELLPAPTNSTEFDDQYTKMFRALQGICEDFEDRMKDKPSSRDVYALSTLYSQMREVISDIRASADMSSQIHELEATAYTAFMRSVGQSYITILFNVNRILRTRIDDPDIVHDINVDFESMIKDVTLDVQESYESMLQRVREVLG